MDHLIESMEQIGFVPHNDPDRVARTFRKMLDRLGPDEREIRVLRGVLRQAIWKLFHPGEKDEPQESTVSSRPVEED